MFGWWVPPHCTLCRFDGEVCKKKCDLDKGCYVDECGKITTKGCCEVELQLFENRVRKKCRGSPPGCGDGGRRGGPNVQKNISTSVFVCKADLEVLMLFIRLSVCLAQCCPNDLNDLNHPNDPKDPDAPNEPDEPKLTKLTK